MFADDDAFTEMKFFQAASRWSRNHKFVSTPNLTSYLNVSHGLVRWRLMFLWYSSSSLLSSSTLNHLVYRLLNGFESQPPYLVIFVQSVDIDHTLIAHLTRRHWPSRLYLKTVVFWLKVTDSIISNRLLSFFLLFIRC